jgi:hypothetical protein
MRSDLYKNNHPKTNIKNTGFKDVVTVQKTLNKIKNRSIIYQKSVVNTMYNRAKYHPYKTLQMRLAMKILKNWLQKNKNKKIKYPYAKLADIKKYEPLAKKYGLSKVSRGEVKSSKTEKGFLVMYKKYGLAKLPFIPIFKNKPEKGDYDIYREKFINARLGQMKKMGIKFYKNGEPTKQHLVLIMNGFLKK